MKDLADQAHQLVHRGMDYLVAPTLVVGSVLEYLPAATALVALIWYGVQIIGYLCDRGWLTCRGKPTKSDD